MTRVSSDSLSFVVCLILQLHFLQVPASVASRRSCNSHHIRTFNKECGKFNKFLQNVMQARDDLSWIDEVAGQMRTSELFYSNPVLREKINAMFFHNDKPIWYSLEIKNRHRDYQKRRKRSSKRKQAYVNPSANDKNLNSRESTRADQNLTCCYARQVNRTRNAIPKTSTTTEDPLDKLLRSINVFPVGLENRSRESYDLPTTTLESMSNDSNFSKNRFETNPLNGKMTTNGIKEIFDKEHPRVARSLKSSFPDIETMKKNFSELLKIHNEDDNSQMHDALNGDLAKKIVDAILNQLKSKKESDTAIRSEFRQIDKPLDSIVFENVYNRELKSEEDNRTVTITKKLMELVEQMISDELEKRTCASLPSVLENFLQWLLETDNYEYKNDEILDEKKTVNADKNLSEDNSILNLNVWYEKADILNNLLYDYEELSDDEKNKVQAIYEYLITRIEFVEAYIEAYKSHTVNRDEILKIRLN